MRSQQELASIAAKQIKIQQLISEGKNREAYRLFEELPIKEQLGISVTPVVGEGLAAFEVGEFGKRAEERFAQDDRLGGLGNRLLQGLAGLGTLPVIGAIPRVARGLTRFAKVGDNIPGGGGSSLPVIKDSEFEYFDTRSKPFLDMDGVPIDLDRVGGDGRIETFDNPVGLISPSRKALSEFPNKPKKLGNLVSDLKKKVPGKLGELEMLNVITKNGDLHPDLTNYFRANLDRVTPEGLNQYMASKQPGTLRSVPVNREIANNASDTARDAFFRGVAGRSEGDGFANLYYVKNADGKNYGDMRLGTNNVHYNKATNDPELDRPYAFDGFRFVPEYDSVQLSRLQSDRTANIAELRRKRNSMLGEGEGFGNPHYIPTVGKGFDTKVQDLKRYVDNYNDQAKAQNKDINLFRGEDLLFDDFILKEGTSIDDIRKADDETLQSLVVNNPNPKMIGTQPAEKINLTREEKFFIKESESRKLKKITDAGQKLDVAKAKVEAGAGSLFSGTGIDKFIKAGLIDEDFISPFQDGVKAIKGKGKTLINTDEMSEGAKRIANRKNYYAVRDGLNPNISSEGGVVEYSISPNLYANSEATIKRLAEISKKGINKAATQDNIPLTKKGEELTITDPDPYVKGSNTQQHKFPTRKLVNDLSSTTNVKYYDVLPKANEIPSATVAREYKAIYDEMLKIYRELGLDPDEYVRIEPVYQFSGYQGLDQAYPAKKFLTPSEYKAAAKLGRGEEIEGFLENLAQLDSKELPLTDKAFKDNLSEASENLIKKGIRSTAFLFDVADLPSANLYQFDLDPIRKALAEGKRIPAFKEGGFVSIDDMLAEL